MRIHPIERPTPILRVAGVSLRGHTHAMNRTIALSMFTFSLLLLPACEMVPTEGGEPWTIQCIQIETPQHEEHAEQVAETLKRTSGIKPELVHVNHKGSSSTVTYGQYLRTVDPRTAALRIPRNMKRDLKLIKELGDPQRGPMFRAARIVPEADAPVGNPEYDLNNANGYYTLRVATFTNTPAGNDRREAAAAYAAELRKMGYEAYYRHGADISEVTVGSFGKNALNEVTRTVRGPSGIPGKQMVQQLSPEVRSLQAKETFAYELFNMRRVAISTGQGKAYRSSVLVEIHPEVEAWK